MICSWKMTVTCSIWFGLVHIIDLFQYLQLLLSLVKLHWKNCTVVLYVLLFCCLYLWSFAFRCCLIFLQFSFWASLAFTVIWHLSLQLVDIAQSINDSLLTSWQYLAELQIWNLEDGFPENIFCLQLKCKFLWDKYYSLFVCLFIGARYYSLLVN